MTKKHNPYWYKLIKKNKEKGIITTGLTIPYIYGSYKVLDCPFPSIEELINEIHQLPIDKYPIIQKCNEIHHHVIMVEKKGVCHKEYLKDVKLANSNGDNFLYISSNTNLGKTFKIICSNLKTLYDKPISEGNYSWSNKIKQWRKFDEKEIELIKSIK